jgi:pimeloyl-ACP methyl ester carboxylesterase
MADDTVAALAELGIARADVFGYSMGAGVALQVALRHAAAVRKLVLASLSYTRSGFHPALLDGMDQLTPDALAGSPWHAEYTRLAPHPEAFATLVAKVTRLNRAIQDVPAAAIQAITAPTLLIVGAADIIRPEHAVELFRLRGGGVAGDLVGLPPAQLAILPGTTMRRWCSAPTCCGRSSRHSWTRPCPPAPEPHGA